jgi:amino acid permease
MATEQRMVNHMKNKRQKEIVKLIALERAITVCCVSSWEYFLCSFRQ